MCRVSISECLGKKILFAILVAFVTRSCNLVAVFLSPQDAAFGQNFAHLNFLQFFATASLVW